MYTRSVINVIRELSNTVNGLAGELASLSDDQKNAIECVGIILEECRKEPKDRMWQRIYAAGATLSAYNIVLDYTRKEEIWDDDEGISGE